MYAPDDLHRLRAIPQTVIIDALEYENDQGQRAAACIPVFCDL